MTELTDVYQKNGLMKQDRYIKIKLEALRDRIKHLIKMHPMNGCIFIIHKVLFLNHKIVVHNAHHPPYLWVGILGYSQKD